MSNTRVYLATAIDREIRSTTYYAWTASDSLGFSARTWASWQASYEEHIKP